MLLNIFSLERGNFFLLFDILLAVVIGKKILSKDNPVHYCVHYYMKGLKVSVRVGYRATFLMNLKNCLWVNRQYKFFKT